MTKEMGFLIALCTATAVCYALLERANRIRAERRFARRSAGRGSGDAGLSASSDNWSLASWASSDTSSGPSDSSGNQADSGSCGGSGDSGDSGGGGDCGGGGGTD